jgi:hypothetical protein
MAATWPPGWPSRAAHERDDLCAACAWPARLTGARFCPGSWRPGQILDHWKPYARCLDFGRFSGLRPWRRVHAAAAGVISIRSGPQRPLLSGG